MTALLLYCLPALALAQQNDHPGLDATGLQPNREYFAQLPFERIDTLSGSVVLTFTDLVLPGDAGRELRFQRTYNSKSRKWTFGLAGVALRITNPAYPTTAPNPGPQEQTPNLLMGDGSVKRTAWWQSPSVGDQSTLHITISQDFWQLNRGSTPPTLKIPNGDTCEYENDLLPNMLRIKECVDPFGNKVTFEWLVAIPSEGQPAKLLLKQEFDSDYRLITLKFGGPDPQFPTSIDYENSTWEYDFSGNDLMTAGGPENRTWTFAYNSELVSLQTPDGGIVSYTYGTAEYPVPDDPVMHGTRVLTVRETDDGRGIVAGRWDYSYNIGRNGQGGLSTETTVETSSTRTTYKYEAEPQHALVFDGEGGALPLRSRKVEWWHDDEWVPLEEELREYEIVPVLSYFGFGTLELSKRTVTRDDGGLPFVTEIEYSDFDFGDYHNPKKITETGTVGGGLVDRVTTRTYHHLTTSARYAVGLPLTEAVTVDGVTYDKSWTYDVLTGFKTEETIHGITTRFAKDDDGNVRRVTKANNKSTLFEYQYGQVSKVLTPEHTTTRAINPNGTIESQTIAGRKTEFDYDDLGRVVSIAPPNANETVIDYEADNGEWVWTNRGGAVTKVHLDGFGRKIYTIDPVGVEARTRYDAEGRVVHEGYPFRPADTDGNVDKWTTIAYDAIGRVTTRTQPDTSTVVYTYGTNGGVTIQEEIAPSQTRSTLQTWQAFGDPGQARLAKVVDPSGQEWNYSYHALGKLAGISVTDPLRGTINRSWTYYPTTGLLHLETHPESGQTSYVYDSSGNLSSKTDAEGVVTKFQYDGNDRVKAVMAGTRETLVAYEPGSDNRTAAVNPFAGIVWRYDPLTGRLQSRQDRVGEKAFTTVFEYNGNDQVTSVMHPSGRRIQFDLNGAGQPTRIFEAAAGRNYATSITYHASGAVRSYTAGNGTTTAIGHDGSRYWTTSLVSGPLNLNYAVYDRVGNPTTITDARSGYGQSLEYDVLDRLIDASGIWGSSTSYEYDAHGNRKGAGYQYQSGTLRLTNQAGVGFTYDNNGNALTIGTATFTYTPQNQVETAAVPGMMETYAYDADDQRVKKTDGASTTYYIRSSGGQLLTEWKDPGTSTGRIRDYIYLGSQLLSAVARNSSENPAISDPGAPSTQSHRYASSSQVPGGSGGQVNLTSGISAVGRASMHPDMPMTGLWIGTQTNGGIIDTLTPGPQFQQGTEAPKKAGVFFEFEVRRRPSSQNAEFLAIAGTASSWDVLKLYMTPSGELVLQLDWGYNPPQTVWTSSPIELGTVHTLEIRVEFNSNGNHNPPVAPFQGLTSWVQVIFDGEVSTVHGAGPGSVWTSSASDPNPLTPGGYGGVDSFSRIHIKSPGSANGLLMNMSRTALVAVPTPGQSLDIYGTSWRTTLLQPAAAGTYAEWTDGPADWRGRSIVSGDWGFGYYLDTVRSTNSNQKISYRMESMLSRRITGTIGNVLVGIRMQFAQGASVFIRRNGVETVLTDFVPVAGQNTWYRVANAGWLPTDVIEVGVISGWGNNYLNAVALIVEHDTRAPEMPTDTSARVLTYSYAGDGGAQTIDFGVDQLPTALFVVPIDAPGGREPMWWWNSRLGAAPMAEQAVGFRRIWPQKGKLHVTHTVQDSMNQNGVNYLAIALFDPSGRYVLPFAVAKPTADDNYTHHLRYPYSGDPATDFTPDFVFGGAAFNSGSGDDGHSSVYRGPGHAGDSTGLLGTTAASDGDRIQALGAGTVQFGTKIGQQSGDHAFWAGRVSDGVSSERLMAVTSYVGDGTGPRNIALTLGGSAPVFALVVPTNASAKIYRVTGETTGRDTYYANAYPNSITALGANQITVGSALNASGVTYDVWAITTGFVAPK